ncbi:hypothetical protein BJY01DRAFT_193650 [Aspergillus pseudoustus]|uniref:Uncharacterized protein n=1 Tax=Aspergillus pseudoustus TaxID=1810923 RepID=A0ABR4JU18_9EURO
MILVRVVYNNSYLLSALTRSKDHRPYFLLGKCGHSPPLVVLTVDALGVENTPAVFRLDHQLSSHRAIVQEYTSIGNKRGITQVQSHREEYFSFLLDHRRFPEHSLNCFVRSILSLVVLAQGPQPSRKPSPKFHPSNSVQVFQAFLPFPWISQSVFCPFYFPLFFFSHYFLPSLFLPLSHLPPAEFLFSIFRPITPSASARPPPIPAPQGQPFPSSTTATSSETQILHLR